MEITQATADSLSAKLDALELTEGEAQLLAGMVRAASKEPEVQGHGWDEGVAAFTLGFKGVKCDVHPWAGPVSAKGGSPSQVVINHEEQYS